jgi:hypothetical protein
MNIRFYAAFALVPFAPLAVSAQIAWDGNGTSSSGGNWSTAVNWAGDIAPATGNHTAVLGDTGADRTISYDAAASGTLGNLSFTQSSAFANRLELQRSLSVTAPIAMGATTGTERITVGSTAAAGFALTCSGGMTLDPGGQLILTATGNGGSGFNYGNVGSANTTFTLQGGTFTVAPTTGNSSSGSAANTLSGNLVMTSGSLVIENAGGGASKPDRRLTVSGNVTITGGTISSTLAGINGSLAFQGAQSTLNPASFDTDLNVSLEFGSGQALSTNQTLGNVLVRGTGIKTLTSSVPGTGIGQLQLFDGNNATVNSRTTLQLGSNLTLTSGRGQPAAQSFGNTAEAGRIDLGIDTNGFTLDLSAGAGSGVWSPNASTQSGVTTTAWQLTGAGAIKARAFLFNTANVSTLVDGNLTLEATGAGTVSQPLVNNLSGLTISPGLSPVFRYTGNGSATLASTAALLDYQVESGTLSLLSGAPAPASAPRFTVGGILNLPGSATLAGATRLKFSATSAGRINAATQLTYGGNLTLDFTAGDAYRAGVFTLFSAPTLASTGVFSSVALAGVQSGSLTRDAAAREWRGTFSGLSFTLSEASGQLVITSSEGNATIPSDPAFFAQINLDFVTAPALLPHVTNYKNALAAAGGPDYPAARAALAAYFRARSTPVFPIPTFTPDNTAITNALNETYTVIAVTYDFGATLDWSFNPTTNPEWTWQLNRHGWWDDLAQKYRSNPAANLNYLQQFLFELQDWISTSPTPPARDNAPGSRWRTIEAGIRIMDTWPSAFYRVKNAPQIGDDLLILWLKSFYMHAEFLRVVSAGSGNWMAMEGNGLFTVGALFPEFTLAPAWRSTGVQRLLALINDDVLSDGSHDEFSPGYHSGVIDDLAGAKSLGVLNNIPLSPSASDLAAFDAKLESLYNYLMLAMEPSGNVPTLNDSWPLDVRSRLAEAATLFPSRTDFQWVGSNGVSGTMPGVTSHLFTEAGQAVMRSGWSSTAGYALFEAGPYGVNAHQNEDKLSLNVNGYGIRHIIDGGTYDYDASSPYRAASVGSRANSQPLVDDLEQNRKASGSANWLTRTPFAWRTHATYDYAAASYGVQPFEGWGPSRIRPATTRRHVFFVKPDWWVVIDAFKPADAAAHRYSALFHCNDDTVVRDATTQRITVQLTPTEVDPYTLATVTSARASLTITPLLANGQTSQIIEGQDTPYPLGWLYIKDTNPNKRPIPTVRYDRTVAGDTQMAYVLAASPAASAARTPTITRAVTSADTYGVTVSFGVPGDERTFLIGLDETYTTYNGTPYKSPALVATASGAFAWGDATAASFASWAAAPGFALSVANRTATADPDADGVPNLLEYVLGGQPNLSDAGALLPALSRNTGGDYLFTFRRSDISQTGTSLVVQHSTNLVTWTDVPVGATSSGAVNVQQNTPSPDMDTITVTIANPGAAPCFARLRATTP